MTQAAQNPAPTIPLIDIAALASPVAAERAAVGAALREACLAYGFFYIRGHGVSPALVAAMFEQARRFFDLPVEAKMRLNKTQSAANRGYEPLNGQRLEAGAPPDLKESFFLGADLPAEDPRVVRKQFGRGANLWPDLPGFRPVAEDYYATLAELGGRLYRGLALALGVAETYFDGFYADPVNVLRFIHYPEQPANPLPDQKGCGAHTDFGGLTILAQDGSGGLQVWDGRDAWIDATPIPDTFVVNLGDFVARWTNDRFRSTLHRVINTSGRERYSIPFFCNGDPDTVVSCVPTCLAPGEAAKYPPTNVADHFAELYRRTYLV